MNKFWRGDVTKYEAEFLSKLPILNYNLGNYSGQTIQDMRENGFAEMDWTTGALVITPRGKQAIAGVAVPK